MPPRALNDAFHTIRNEDGFSILPSKCAICQILTSFGGCDNSRFGNALGVNYENRPETRMANEQATFFIHRKTIWTSTAEGLEEQASFSRTSIGIEW